MAQEIADSKLLDTWGSGGAKIEPDISKIIEGWQLGEQPPHEYMNWLQNTFGSKLNHILKNGVASWNNTTQYLAGATVQHTGNVWLCKTTNTDSAPTDSNNNWDKIPSLENLALTVDSIDDFPAGATTGDTCIVKDLDRGGIFIYDSTKVSEHNQGTNFNGWIRQYSGAVNVKWFGAKGDGVTDDTVAIQNAVDYAMTSTQILHFMDNYSYLTTQSISSFHEIEHTGGSTLLRGTDTWYFKPVNSDQINITYYSPSGDNNNDGLSQSTPRRTLSCLWEQLRKYNFNGSLLAGVWRFQLLAGTWLNQSLNISYSVNSTYAIQIWGSEIGSEPASNIVFNNLESAQLKPIIFGLSSGSFDVKNIDVYGYSSGSTFYQYGFFKAYPGPTQFTSCRAKDCTEAFSIDENAYVGMNSTIARTSNIGYRASYGSTVTVGTEGSVAYSTDCKIGVYYTRNAVGHVTCICDNPVDKDINIGLIVDMASRAHVHSSSFIDCLVGVKCMSAAEWANDKDLINTFINCTTNYIHWDVSREVGLYGQTAMAFRRIGFSTNAYVVTGTTNASLLCAIPAYTGSGIKPIPANFFTDIGKTLKIRIAGNIVGTNGTKTLSLRIGTTSWIPISLGNSEGLFDIEVEIHATSATTQFYLKKGIHKNTSVFTDTGVASGVFSGTDKNIRVYAQLTNEADSVTLSFVSMDMCG